MRKNNDFNSSDNLQVRDGINEKLTHASAYNGSIQRMTMKVATLNDTWEDYNIYTRGKEVSSITVVDETKTIKVGESYYAGITYDPTKNKPNLTWVSSDTSVATVDCNGLVRGISAGSATLTVYGQYYGSDTLVSDTMTVTVTA